MNGEKVIVRALFEEEDTLLKGAQLLRERGCPRPQCYSPYPIEALDELWELPRSRLPRVAFVAGLTGAIGGYAMQQYAMGIHYPHNIGGRPLWSWPLFLPITFELMVLTAALVTMLALLITLRLPRLHQPVLNSPLAARISQDAYLLEAEPDETACQHHGPRAAAQALVAALTTCGATQTEIVAKGGPEDA